MKTAIALPTPVLPLPRGRRGRHFMLYCLAAVALPLGFAVAAAYPTAVLEPPPTPKRPLVPHQASRAPHQDVVRDAPMPVDLHRFALNALLVPLLDDAVPRRWTDVAIAFDCEPGTSVLVDGQPLVAGQVVPATAFTLRWDMHRCAPLGQGSVVLSGSVELLVFHEDEGYSAVVIPVDLRADSHLGQARLRGPFTAEMAL